MHYKILAPIFFISIFIFCFAVICVFSKRRLYTRSRKKFWIILSCWFVPYALMIIFMTGPTELHRYPPREQSPYKLPWKAGIERFVAQGNRSFTSHRDFHEYARDFVMPNVIEIEHEDGQRSGYAHIQKNGALVNIGDHVTQGQPIFPHVHFYVTNKEGTSSIPITFSDVDGGIPTAGNFYTSKNPTP